MSWRIPLEILLATLALFLGTSFWAVAKSPAHLRGVLGDIGELTRFVDFLGRDNLIKEAESVKPVFGSYLKNIQLFEKAHLIALNKTRNILSVLTILLIGASYFVGLTYMIINIAFFLLPVVREIPASAKDNNITHVHTVILNVYEWNKTDPGGCLAHCINDSGLKQIHCLVNKLR